MKISDRRKKALVDAIGSLETLVIELKNCGAGSAGNVGFQSNNTCARGSGSSDSGKDKEKPKPAAAPKKPVASAASKRDSDKSKPEKTGGSKLGGRITHERTTPPPPGSLYKPNVESDKDKDGVTDYARVGVGARDVPPPPKLSRLPNLTNRERKAEQSFMKEFHKNPDKMTEDFRQIVKGSTKPGDPPTFGTDDAKVLSSLWHDNNLPLNKRSVNRATLNVALHQTANAIAKRAFVKELDGLKKGDEIMVTVGGCGAGKGYALKNVPQALSIKQKSKAVWDSAGDQNATENPWIQSEAQKRGIKVNYVYVHADPKNQWANPERGVVKRAGDPNDGRMVDAKVFADSYAIGAKNHQAFYERNKDNKFAAFIFLENKGKPILLEGIPKEALNYDRHDLAKFAAEVVRKSDAPAHVKRGALVGFRIWKDD